MRYVVFCFNDLHRVVLGPCLEKLGYDLLPVCPVTDDMIDKCLSIIGNEVCYVTVHLLAQVISTLEENALSPDEVTIMLPMLCVDCRSEEAPRLLAKIMRAYFGSVFEIESLKDHLAHVSAKNSIWTTANIRKCSRLLCAADVLQQVYLRMSPYIDTALCDEIIVRSIKRLVSLDLSSIEADSYLNCIAGFGAACDEALQDVANRRSLVAIVGSYPLVFCDAINDSLPNKLMREGCEVRKPCTIPFLQHFLKQQPNTQALVCALADAYSQARTTMAQESQTLDVLLSYEENRVESIPSHLTCGTGALFAETVAAFLESGTRNILYARSFACLPGHTLGQGTLKLLRERYDTINLISVEYDPGASKVNQDNRIKLLTTLARGIASEISATNHDNPQKR